MALSATELNHKQKEDSGRDETQVVHGRHHYATWNEKFDQMPPMNAIHLRSFVTGSCPCNFEQAKQGKPEHEPGCYIWDKRGRCSVAGIFG